jgi:two-component system response regulator NreC
MTQEPQSTHTAPVHRTRLVVADDHSIVLEGLVALLDREPDMQVVGQATTGRGALEEVRRTHPDVALLDITMPEMSGLEVTRHLTDELPEVRVLILTMHDEEAFFFEALQAGASGYILKGAGRDEVLSAIAVVTSGGVYIAPQLAKGLVREALNHEGSSELATAEPLTDREQGVLRLIAEGLTNKEIADRLILSVNTVKTHRLRLYQKLHLHTRAELVAFARRKGILR